MSMSPEAIPAPEPDDPGCVDVSGAGAVLEGGDRGTSSMDNNVMVHGVVMPEERQPSGPSGFTSCPGEIV